MIRVASTAVLIAAFAGPALADNRLEAAFENTVVSTYPDGRTAKLWLQRDGTYTGQGRKGGQTGGRWSIKGEKICLKQARPVPIPLTYCTDIIQGGVGTRWSGKAITGEPVRLELVSGR